VILIVPCYVGSGDRWYSRLDCVIIFWISLFLASDCTVLYVIDCILSLLLLLHR